MSGVPEFFKGNLADVVISVESSHCIPDLEAFFREVSGVLKQDGVFIYSDFIQSSKQTELDSQINAYFHQVKRVDIRRNIFHSLELSNKQKLETLRHNVPFYLRVFMRSFLAVEDTEIYQGLKYGEYTYFVYILKKKPLNQRSNQRTALQ